MSYIIEIRVEVEGSKRKAENAARKIAALIEHGSVRDAVSDAGVDVVAYDVRDPIPRDSFMMREMYAEED